MGYISFDRSKGSDLVLSGRVAIDFNPVYNEQVKGGFKPLKNAHMFEKFVGGSPANTPVGITKYGTKADFIGKVSDDQLGEHVTDYFNERGIDTSQISKTQYGEKLGLTFTEMLPPEESSILMYRNQAANLRLSVEDIDEDYLKRSKALLISGTALAEGPSRGTVLKAVMLARENNVKIIFDIDYREHNWKNVDGVAIYYSIVMRESDITMGSGGEPGLTERLIQPDMTGNESTVFWHNCGAQIVIIKHGVRGSIAYTADYQQFSTKPFPVETHRGFGGGDGHAAGLLCDLLEGWEIIDCSKFDSAEASMIARSNNCSDSLPTTQEVKELIKLEKEMYGEMIARIQGG